MLPEDMLKFQALYRRASQHCYYKYRVNKLELWLLQAFAGMLVMHKRRAMSFEGLMQQITGNSKYRGKARGYWRGLIELGCVSVVLTRSKLESYYITEHGQRVLNLFRDHYERLEKLMVKRGERGQVGEVTQGNISPRTVAEVGNKYAGFKDVLRV